MKFKEYSRSSVFFFVVVVFFLSKMTVAKVQLSKMNYQIHWSSDYTPGIHADGYIVFAFPFVCSFVSSFLRS